MKQYLLTFLLSVSFTVAHGQAVLLRGPYLQVATPTSIVIRWRTDKPSTSVVKIGGGPAVARPGLHRQCLNHRT